jgi:hypothetical protein
MGSGGRGGDFGPAAGAGGLAGESPSPGDLVDEAQAAAVLGIRAISAHVRDAEGAVITDIDADERFADRDGDGDRGRVEGVDQAVGDQLRGKQERLISSGMTVGGLPDEPPRRSRGV